MIDESMLVSNSKTVKRKEATEVTQTKNVKQVAQGKSKKRSLGRRFADIFLDEDVESVKEYIVFDVIIPTIKDGVLDMLSMLFYGRPRGKSKGGTYISYNNMSSKSRTSRPSERRRVSNYQDIILESRSEAEDVLDVMREILDKYKEVSVADLYDACGITGVGYTDNQFGWDDLHGVNIRRCHEGYLLDLPRPIPLD